MSIMVNKSGDVLLTFIPIRREESLDMVKFAPFTHSLIVLRYKGTTLLVHDIYKNRWEVPGGKIEQGETPHTCILRELKEETGQVPTSIQLEGVMQVFSKEKNQVVYGALYSGNQDIVMPFTENSEVSQIIYWDGRSDIGYIDEIDQKLTELV
ncbi:MAG TPA: NUDIX hydrolase [Dehalococcoidales bacterium]